MPDTAQLWMRQESRPGECRAPIVPEDAARLVRSGIRVTVEESPQRVFPLARYADAGCRIVAGGSWEGAPRDAFVIGLKELPPRPIRLRHRHIYFGHAYKGQHGAEALLARFSAGGGTLLDLEYLVDGNGRRLAAFGYWAGYVGAALAVLHATGRLDRPLVPLTRQALDTALHATTAHRGPGEAAPRAVVIGALGRCGQGACDALEAAGLPPTRWDLAETADLDRAALLAHDLLVNTVLTTRPLPPFLTSADLGTPGPDRRLSTICDVTCDVTSECNLLPVYDEITDWDRPVRRLRDGNPPVDLIAIDNLPSLLPEEASRAFSADLLPQLLRLMSQGDAAPAWARCRDSFAAAVRTASKETEHAR
ncbi:saccharopine dehydrogenase [Streptomyces sp. NPDC006733]|uniref:saccharopine dehydrogenase n=1 Tax=Streptomyces sp. NPDC006733 TaxID=3155460 RepID=UPI0033DCE3F5